MSEKKLENSDYTEELRVALSMIYQQEMNAEALDRVRDEGRIAEYLLHIRSELVAMTATEKGERDAKIDFAGSVGGIGGCGGQRLSEA